MTTHDELILKTQMTKSHSNTNQITQLFISEERKESVAILSRLMAQEDINVVLNANFLENSLGLFDIKNRTLFIAPLKDEYEYLLPGTLGHEIGHARESNIGYNENDEKIEIDIKDLFTLSSDPSQKDKVLHTIWNSIEDGYCDRKMLASFPGWRKYRKLNIEFLFDNSSNRNKDFFDEEKVNRGTVLLNTLTYNSKYIAFGKSRLYPLWVEKEDVDFLNSCAITSKKDVRDRIELARRAKDIFLKYSSDIDTIEEYTDSDNLLSREIETIIKSTIERMENGEQVIEINDSNSEFCDQLSVIPRFADFNSINDLVWEVDIMSHMMCEPVQFMRDGWPFSHENSSLEKISNLNRKLFEFNLSKAKAQANKMYRYFAGRLNAINLCNRRSQKTGILDPLRSSLFQIYDDIFQKKTIDLKQKNHSYVVMLDWSSSMDESTESLVQRILELTHFAELANVELDINLFTSHEYSCNNSRDVQNLISSISKIGNAINAPFNSDKKQYLNGLIGRRATVIHVLNTKKHSKVNMLNRLRVLFFLGRLTGQGFGLPVVSRTMMKYIDTVYSQYATCIYEAILYGGRKLMQMGGDRRNLIIMADGSDFHFNEICIAENNFNFSITNKALLDEKLFRMIDDGNIQFQGMNICPKLVSMMSSNEMQVLNAIFVSSGNGLTSLNKFKREIVRNKEGQIFNTLFNFPNQSSIIIRTFMTKIATEYLLQMHGIATSTVGWELNSDKSAAHILKFIANSGFVNIVSSEKNYINNKTSRKKEKQMKVQYSELFAWKVPQYNSAMLNIENKFITKIGDILLGHSMSEFHNLLAHTR